MNFFLLDGLAWLLLMLGPLLLLQPVLHREIQAVFLLLTRRPALTIGLFSLIFFPGVLLHEGSHFVVARLLGVRTGRISLIPQPAPGGKLRLGFVETVPTDILRDALIGIAPLLTGGILVAYVGITRLGLLPVGDALLQGNSDLFWQSLTSLPQQPDFWLWFYLTFTVSSTMLPSTADRRAWLPVTLTLVTLLGLALLAGAGPWMLAHIAVPFNQAMHAVAGVFAISLSTNTAALLPVWLIRRLLNRLTGLEVT
jgi:hypothetical protein